jgi:hypothetical protein
MLAVQDVTSTSAVICCVRALIALCCALMVHVDALGWRWDGAVDGAGWRWRCDGAPMVSKHSDDAWCWLLMMDATARRLSMNRANQRHTCATYIAAARISTLQAAPCPTHTHILPPPPHTHTRRHIVQLTNCNAANHRAVAHFDEAAHQVSGPPRASSRALIQSAHLGQALKPCTAKRVRDV